MSGTKRAKGDLPVFRDHFGIDARGLDSVFATALAKPVDYADVFFEYTVRDAVSLEEGIVKSGARSVEQGVGVRAQSGERQGYAHADEITLESVKLAAGTARAIAEGSSKSRSVALRKPALPAFDLYGLPQSPTEVPIDTKVRLLQDMDAYARSRDPRIAQVMASVSCEERHLMIAASDATWVSDVQPLVVLRVQVIAVSG
ncbi:MAG: PmbA/TldA family metallopeptidase, partial [bacterium]